MLPALRPLAQLLAVALSLVLLLPLAACGGVGQPPHAPLLAALALQIELTQDSIAQALCMEDGGSPEVDWRLSGDPIRVDSPFELYLQRGERGESWRLARPLMLQDDAVQWLIDPLPVRS